MSIVMLTFSVGATMLITYSISVHPPTDRTNTAACLGVIGITFFAWFYTGLLMGKVL